MERTRVIALQSVNMERDRQQAKWREENHEPPVWLGIFQRHEAEKARADSAQREKGGNVHALA